jgi:hypothetical protein
LGWDYLNIYFLAYTLIRWSELAPKFSGYIPNDPNGILFPWIDNPQDFYFDSKLQRQILANSLITQNKNIKAFRVSPKTPFKPNAYFYEINCDTLTNESALCHFPTSFYDAAYHAKRIKEKYGEKIIDIQSPYFDVPILDKRIRIGPSRIDVSRIISANFERKIKDINKKLFIEIGIGACNNFELQHQHLFKRFAFQYDSYKKLEKKFSNLESLEICCHDTGLSGPLISLSEKFNIKTIVWPHSTFINNPLRSHDNLVLTSCSRVPSPFLSLGLSTHQSLSINKEFKSNSYEKIKHPRALMILMNELDDVAGIPLVDFFLYKSFLKELINHFLSKQYKIFLRQKPSHSYASLFSEFKNYESSGQLSDYLDRVGVCVSLGTPTTALSKFLLVGKDCLHVQFESMTDVEKYTIPEAPCIITRDISLFKKFLSNTFK